ncbi:MAG: hypothetical protein WC777_04440 [Candidatus Gracilibacteria bacterium]|jgi:hypothetical protein
MSFLYNRVETKDKVKISFKNYYLWYLNITAIFAMAFVKPGSELTYIATILVFLLLLAIFLYQFIVRMNLATEIGKAMKNGSVEVSGSKFSNKNPLTYIIKK